MRDIPTSKQHKLDYGETLVQISDHPLCDIAKVVIKGGNKLLNLIKCFVMFNKKTVQLKIDTKAGVANVTDGKNGDFTGTPWKIIRSFQMGSVREDVVDQALNFIQSLVKPIEESDKGLIEAIETLESAGYVCERYRGDDYVSDHLMNVEVPGLVHSCVAGLDHYFDTEEEADYEAQLVIYSERGRKSFRVWCKIDPMKDPLIEKGELPDFFWKKSSYSDGEMSRVSRWIKRKIETLRQSCLLRVKELSDLS